MLKKKANSQVMPEETSKNKGNKQQKIPAKVAEKDSVDMRKVIVVLQKANLVVARVKKDEVLLNSDQHTNYITKKLKRDPGQFRPDITHQSLLTLMDSPLNKAGKLQVFITTASNQVIEINPHTRIPRTYKRFAPLMVHLLKKLRIRAEESSQTLLKVVESPVTKHLPPDSIKIAGSTKGKLVNFYEYAQKLQEKQRPIVLLVGAVAKGNPTMQVQYYDEAICISKYGLSASNCIARMLTSFQLLWDIL